MLSPFLTGRMFVRPNILRNTLTNYDSFLNWTFSSPNMVRTQFQTLLHSQLACNEMQASAQTCGRRAADSNDRKCRLKSSDVKSIYFHHPAQGNSTNYYLILGLPRPILRVNFHPWIHTLIHTKRRRLSWCYSLLGQHWTPAMPLGCHVYMGVECHRLPQVNK